MTDIYTLIAALGPGLAEGLAATGTALGIAAATASGIPTLAEEPGMRGKIFILAFLPMTQTLVYGFAYMFISYFVVLPSLLAKYGGTIPPFAAGAILGVSILVGLAEMVSAWQQGVVCGQVGAQLIKTRGGIFGIGVILAIFEELFGILGLVFGLLVLFVVIV